MNNYCCVTLNDCKNSYCNYIIVYNGHPASKNFKNVLTYFDKLYFESDEERLLVKSKKIKMRTLFVVLHFYLMHGKCINRMFNKY